MTNIIDFNLHNLFSIRLIDPAPEAIAAVKSQTGLQPAGINEEPDLTVSYVDRFTDSMCHTIMGDAGFTDDDFYVVTNIGDKDYRAHFPFADLGQPCKIICESGMTEIPLFKLIINMRMLAKGLMPIHAAAFISEGVGVIANGWPKGGKTSTLFSFLTHGAKFVSDEWLYVDADKKVYGLMQPIKLSDWQLEQLPVYQRKVSRKKRWAIQILHWLDAFEQFIPKAVRSGFLPAKAFFTGLRYLNKHQRYATLSPEKLFESHQISPTGNFDLLLLVLSHDAPEITVNPLKIDVAIERLLAALRYEWMKWEEYYTQYLYAFPQKRNLLMDTVWDKQGKLLENMLAGKNIFSVKHPHPVKLDEIYNTVHQILTK